MKTTFTFSLLLCLAATMQGAELLIYDFGTETPTVTSPAASGVDINLDTTDIGFASSGFVFTTSSLLGNPKPSILANASGSQLGSRNATEALANNDYIGFTVTPDSGFEMDLTSFKLDVQALYGTLGVSGDMTEFSFGLFSSVDGFDNTGDMIGSSQNISYTNPSDGANQGGFSTLTFDLSSTTKLSTPTEFRMYVWVSTLTGDNTNYNNRRLALDNVILDGTVSAIPEPASVSLVVAGLASALVLLRRKSQRTDIHTGV